MSRTEEPDPLIDEIHEIRRRIFAEHGNDPIRFYERHIQSVNRQLGLSMPWIVSPRLLLEEP